MFLTGRSRKEITKMDIILKRTYCGVCSKLSMATVLTVKFVKPKELPLVLCTISKHFHTYSCFARSMFIWNKLRKWFVNNLKNIKKTNYWFSKQSARFQTGKVVETQKRTKNKSLGTRWEKHGRILERVLGVWHAIGEKVICKSSFSLHGMQGNW